MKFNELQFSLWEHMLEFINDYRRNGITFSNLVGSLENSLIAGDFPEDENLLIQWYDYWTPLEILNATKGDEVTVQEVDAYLSALQIFLEKTHAQMQSM